MVTITKKLMEKNFTSNPLKDVSLELRFNGKLIIESKPELLQEKSSSDYPICFKEIAPSGKPFFILQKNDKSYTIRYSQSNIVIGCAKYADFDEFKNNADRILKCFAESYGVSEFNRVGLRYINNIRLSYNSKIKPSDYIFSYTNPIIDLSNFKEYSVGNNFAAQVTLVNKDFNLNLTNGFTIPPMEQNIAILLIDLDCYTLNRTTFNKLWDVVYNFKIVIKENFFKLVTNKTLKFMEEGKCK